MKLSKKLESTLRQNVDIYTLKAISRALMCLGVQTPTIEHLRHLKDVHFMTGQNINFRAFKTYLLLMKKL